MNRSLAAFTAAAAVLALTGCGGDEKEAAPAAPSAATTTRAPLPMLVRGLFTIDLPGFVWDPGVCTGTGGYDDINAGTAVTITDNTGATVALGKLGTGQPLMAPDDDKQATGCMFTFDIPDVPAGKGFYGIEVGRRGIVQFEEKDLGERVQLSLG